MPPAAPTPRRTGRCLARYKRSTTSSSRAMCSRATAAPRPRCSSPRTTSARSALCSRTSRCRSTCAHVPTSVCPSATYRALVASEPVPCCVLPCCHGPQLPEAKPFALELSISDTGRARRRLLFSTSFREAVRACARPPLLASLRPAATSPPEFGPSGATPHPPPPTAATSARAGVHAAAHARAAGQRAARRVDQSHL